MATPSLPPSSHPILVFLIPLIPLLLSLCFSLLSHCLSCSLFLPFLASSYSSLPSLLCLLSFLHLTFSPSPSPFSHHSPLPLPLPLSLPLPLPLPLPPFPLPSPSPHPLTPPLPPPSPLPLSPLPPLPLSPPLSSPPLPYPSPLLHSQFPSFLGEHNLAWSLDWRETFGFFNSAPMSVREHAGHTLKSSIKVGHHVLYTETTGWVTATTCVYVCSRQLTVMTILRAATYLQMCVVKY